MVEALTLTPELTLAEVARNLPQAIPILESAGIDYCCKGARSLADAAAASGFTPDELIAHLESAEPNGARAWSERRLSELTRYLSAEHEETIRTTLGRVRAVIESAAKSCDPALVRRIATLFDGYASTVTQHMLNEERDLFPFIEFLESAAASAASGPKPRIAQRVLREFVEHEHFDEQLHAMRELTWQLGNSSAAADLRDAITRCMREVHEHVHLENNVLYPRAIELENHLKRA